MPFTAGSILTAAELSALDGLLNMGSATVATTESTTSTSYTDLATAGPSVTLTTRTFVFVVITAQAWNSSATSGTWWSFAVSGATTLAAADGNAGIVTAAASGDAFRYSVAKIVPVTAGVNTFTMKYKAGANTATFSKREIAVWAP